MLACLKPFLPLCPSGHTASARLNIPESIRKERDSEIFSRERERKMNWTWYRRSEWQAREAREEGEVLQKAIRTMNMYNVMLYAILYAQLCVLFPEHMCRNVCVCARACVCACACVNQVCDTVRFASVCALYIVHSGMMVPVQNPNFIKLNSVQNPNKSALD